MIGRLPMEWVTTSTILERMKKPDEGTVWAQFHDRFRRPLLAFARRWGLPEPEIEDAVQETLTAFLESYSAGKYDRAKGRLSSWLFGIAYQQIANRRRQLGRRAKHEGVAGDSIWNDVPNQEEAEKAWDAEWETSVLEDCLRQARREVADRTFNAFRMVVREGRSPEAVAEELGMSRESVYVAKHRVLKRLAELMQEYEHFQ
jgi:RNA polymerase sigma-70 factor (ECF subfamily)